MNRACLAYNKDTVGISSPRTKFELFSCVWADDLHHVCVHPGGGRVGVCQQENGALPLPQPGQIGPTFS